MRKYIFILIIISSTLLFSNEENNREVTVEGTINYNGNYTLAYPFVCVFDLSCNQVSANSTAPDGSYSFTIEPGDYYIYTFSSYTDIENNLAYGIHPSCLYPEIIHVEEGQIIDFLNLELIDFAPIVLNKFVEPINFGQIEVIPLEFFHMPLNSREQFYLNNVQDNIKIFGAKLFDFIGNGSIEELFFDENAIWCPVQFNVGDTWTTAYVDRNNLFEPIAYYSEMTAICSQVVEINGINESAIITESIDNNSNLIKKWFVNDLGIVKHKIIKFYQNIPYLQMNLLLHDYYIENGLGMTPLDENNRWVYSIIFYQHPTDLISINQDDSVLLKWDPPYGEEPVSRDEIDWLGYHIYEDNILFQTIDATQTEYLITNPSGSHEYFVTAYNDDGDTEPSNTITVIWTGINHQLPKYNAELFQNFPNPFNPITNVSFSINEESLIDISIFNLKGQKVATLVNTIYQKGKHTVQWFGVDNHGKSVSSGLYLYKLNVDNRLFETKKCVLLK